MAVKSVGARRHLDSRGYYAVSGGGSWARAGIGRTAVDTAAPTETAVPLQRQALELLRPELVTLWLDATAAEGTWPAEVSVPAGEVTSRAATQQIPPAGRRPGTDDRTVVLDPRSDHDFGLALSLLPFTTRVEGMSRHGQLLLARQPGDRELQLRLTPGEAAELRASGPGAAAWLTSTGRPGRRRSRSRWDQRSLPQTYMWTVLTALYGVWALPKGITAWVHGSSWHPLGAIGEAAVGAGWLVTSASGVRYLIRRRGRATTTPA